MIFDIQSKVKEDIRRYSRKLKTYLKRYLLQVLGFICVEIITVVSTIVLHVPLPWALVVNLIIPAILVLWRVPKWHTHYSGLTADEQLARENEARKTLAEIIGGIILIAGLFFTWTSLQIAQETARRSQEAATKNLELAREGQITERFTRAIDQLGHNKIEVRLGGIYALERIARESDKDYGPIVEIVTAYIRDHTSQQPGPVDDNAPFSKLAPDIQTALTVLGRRVKTYKNGENQRLDLQRLTLTGAKLNEARFGGADFGYTDLRTADLSHAILEDAILEEANLQGANLSGANCTNVSFDNASLEGVRFDKAILVKARFSHGDLRGVKFREADLREANLAQSGFHGADFRQADLREARGRFDTTLSSANLSAANLSGAYFSGVDLSQTKLIGANLQDADLSGANLQGADLSKTNLQGTNLESANLSGIRNLTVEQLATVKTLYQAINDSPPREQIKQQYRHLVEEPR